MFKNINYLNSTKTATMMDYGNVTMLRSYETFVAGVKDGEIYEVDQNYSKTTTSHINQFKRKFPTLKVKKVKVEDFKNILGV